MRPYFPRSAAPHGSVCRSPRQMVTKHGQGRRELLVNALGRLFSSRLALSLDSISDGHGNPDVIKSRYRMKLAYVTTYDPLDVHAWSGLGMNIKTALEHANIQIECIGNLRDDLRLFYALKRLYLTRVRKLAYFREREITVAKSYARQVEVALEHTTADVVFSPGTTPIAYLRTKKPIVFWTDATFAGMVDFYPEWTNLHPQTRLNGNNMEQAALSRCRLAIYSSDWAARTAIENYEVDPAKVHVVPFGANIQENVSISAVLADVSRREISPCKLLFVGVDWKRKGGDYAVQVAQELRSRGLDAELEVVGCIPPAGLPSFVTSHGFLSKNDKGQRDMLYRLYRQSHFFILPSRAECAAVVLAEANAFGLPVVATDVGGITTIVNGKNGRSFSPSNFVKECVEFILQTYSPRSTYEQLCLSSFEEYRTRLNWDVAGKAVAKLITGCGLAPEI